MVERCLRSVLEQDYPSTRFEILVADGGSNDGTRTILERLSREDARIRMIDNPERLQAPGMNAMIRQARGEIIIRMDVHCEYSPDYVRKCVAWLQRTGAENVGGAQRARPRTPFQRALCTALTSPLGVGGACYRSPDKEGWVDTVFLGAFPRRVFETVGLYDPKAVTNEDADLNQRILATGGRVYLSREIVVHYEPRGSLKALAKQYYRYGRGRARTAVKQRGCPSWRSVLPFIFVVMTVALLAVAWLQPLVLLAAALYALTTGVEAWRVGRKAGARAVPIVWAILPVLHFAHGIGFAVGLWRALTRPDWATPERLAPRPSEAVPLLAGQSRTVSDVAEMRAAAGGAPDGTHDSLTQPEPLRRS